MFIKSTQLLKDSINNFHCFIYNFLQLVIEDFLQFFFNTYGIISLAIKKSCIWTVDLDIIYQNIKGTITCNNHNVGNKNYGEVIILEIQHKEK